MEIKKETYWNDTAVIVSLISLVLLVIVMWVLWVVLYRQVNYPLAMPSFFSMLKMYPGVYKYILPIFGSIIAVFHFVMSIFAYSKDRFISYCLLGGAVFIQVLVLVTVIYYMVFI